MDKGQSPASKRHSGVYFNFEFQHCKRDSMSRITWVVMSFLTMLSFAKADTNFKEQIEMQCGSHRVAITCGKAKADEPKDEVDTRVCVHNTLTFTDAADKVTIPKEPANMISLGVRGSAPEMMGCGKGKDGLYYVQVRFAGCPGISCEMYDLFTESGDRLTVNAVHLRNIIKSKSITFPKDGWKSIEGLGSAY
jgi:hypothetical protein